MKQPVLGIAATALVIAVSLGFISLFEFNTFMNWVSYALICVIPMEIVVGITWQANPSFVEGGSQPAKGLVLMLVCAVAGAVAGYVYWQTVGGGLSDVAPNLMIASIVVVVVTFWMAVMFGGWPFHTLIKNPILAGVAMWVACYAVNYGLYRVFFNFGAMAQAPVYNASLDPGGMFDFNAATVFYVTFIGVLFLLLHFDLWPLTMSGAIMKQPVLGIVWTILAFDIGGTAFYIGVESMGMDPMLFLVRVPIPFIFGTIVVLNMMHNSIFASLKQPVRGIANTAAAAVIGVALAKGYEALAPAITGITPAIGPPGNDMERWLATALLGVTFPFMIFFAEFFRMWPLAGDKKPRAEAKSKSAGSRR